MVVIIIHQTLSLDVSAISEHIFKKALEANGNCQTDNDAVESLQITDGSLPRLIESLLFLLSSGLISHGCILLMT